MIARSLAQIFKCATVSGATHKLAYIHIYTYAANSCVFSLIARGPKQRQVTKFPPFSLGEKKPAAVGVTQNKYESILFLCLTTQRNLLLL